MTYNNAAPKKTEVNGVNEVKNLNEKENSTDPTGSTPGQRGQVAPLNPLDNPPEDPTEPEIERPGYSAHFDWWQCNGQRMRPGLYYHGWGKGQDPEPVDTWICSPIEALAQTEGDDGNAHGLLLRFQTPKGQWREWAAPLYSLKGSGEDLRGELLDMGVRIDPNARAYLSRWLMQQYPRERIVAATQCGWHQDDNARVFVTPERTIGADHVRFQSEHRINDAYCSRGTLAGWREHVAGRCVDNPILMLAVSAAFAGPLLKVARLQEVGGAGLHLVGDSSQGKTTALQAAASVWGGPGFVRTWRGTGNGLEATSVALNDSLLVLDEISESDPREVGNIVYALMNGQGKQRAAATGGARRSARWRVMALSSGERTLAAHMREGQRQAKAGQQARLLDIPATDRAYGAFDALHRHADGRALADSLKQATATNYGAAGVEFVKALTGDSRDLSAYYSDIGNLPVFAGRDGLEVRAAGVFALIGMAGEMATDYGITGWSECQALESAGEMFNTWCQFRGSGQTEHHQILKAVREFLQRHGDSRFSDTASQEPVRDRAGYYRDQSGGRVYYMNSAALTEAGQGFELKRVLEALDSAGWIVEHDSGKNSTRITVGGVTSRLYAVQPGAEDEQ